MLSPSLPGNSSSIRWFLACVLSVAMASPHLAAAAEATRVGWRTDGTGVYAASHPPVRWSKEENVVWSAALPGRSNASPVIVGDRIFVCSEPFDLLCLQKSDGQVLWKRSNTFAEVLPPEVWQAAQKEIQAAAPLQKRLEEIRVLREKPQKSGAAGEAEMARLEAEAAQLESRLAEYPLAVRHTVPLTQEPYNGYTTATPTSDGQHVWAVFGNRVVVCYDLQGNRRWAIVLEDNPQAMWGHTSSPLLVGDKLIVNIERTVALDPLTGKLLWQTRYGQSWGSAVRADVGSEHLILLANGRILRASDGKVLQRVPGLADTSPIVHGGVAYYVDVRSEAHELPTSLAAGVDTLNLKTRWSTSVKGGTVYASAVVHEGLIYAVTTRHVLNVMDASTGESLTVRRLELGSDPAWPSLILAGDHVYVSGRDGTTVVLRKGKEAQEVARNQLEYFISTPVVAEDRLYIRTSQRLWCLGRKE